MRVWKNPFKKEGAEKTIIKRTFEREKRLLEEWKHWTLPSKYPTWGRGESRWNGIRFSPLSIFKWKRRGSALFLPPCLAHIFEKSYSFHIYTQMRGERQGNTVFALETAYSYSYYLQGRRETPISFAKQKKKKFLEKKKFFTSRKFGKRKIIQKPDWSHWKRKKKKKKELEIQRISASLCYAGRYKTF